MAIRYTIFLLNILCVCFLITRTVSARLPNDDIAIIRQRVLELMIWPTDNNIAVTVRNALVYAQTLNSSCYWRDINYEDKNIVAWKTAEHMDRITTVSKIVPIKLCFLRWQQVTGIFSITYQTKQHRKLNKISYLHIIF
jgi:hypothetical protein